MLILFGSYARGDWVEDLATGYFSDFDLLVVISVPALEKNAKLWSKLTKEARRITGHVPVNLMPLNFKDVNTELRKGNYLFVDMVVQGVPLYNSGSICLTTPKVTTPKQRLSHG